MVAQCLSNLFDALDHGIIRDRRALPKIFDQLLFADQRLTMIEQVEEQVERLRPEVLFRSVAFETAPGGVYLDILEKINWPAFSSRLWRRNKIPARHHGRYAGTPQTPA